jgi:hypothetical protein
MIQKSSLGDAKSSLGDAESSLGDATGNRGWYAGGKVEIDVGNKKLWVQVWARLLPPRAEQRGAVRDA